MLSLRHNGFEGELRLYIRYEGTEAWISQVLRQHPDQKINWVIWVRSKPGLPAHTGKSPLRLEIESRLRAWLLQRYHRCLFTLSFAELCSIAERERHGLRTGASDV